MKKPSTIDLVDPDNIDDYFEAIETPVPAISKADSLANQAWSDFYSFEFVIFCFSLIGSKSKKK